MYPPSDPPLNVPPHRKPPKYERFIRPTGLRMTKAHVTHPELKATFCLDIIGIKKNPNGQVQGRTGREKEKVIVFSLCTFGS